MGRFCASVLLLVGACGDNSEIDLGGSPDDQVEPGEVGTVTPRYTPAVCGVMAWDPNLALDPAQDVSVAARPGGGATFFSAPLGGGTLTGFQLDPRMNMENGTVVKLPITNASFDKVAVSYIQNRPVSTAIADGAVYLHMLDNKLETAEYIAKLPALSISEPTFLYAQGNLVMPVGTKDGLVMHRFVDDSLEPLDSKLFSSTKPVISVTSAQLQTNMMTAYSTETECYLMVNSTYEPGVSARVERACPSPRLAVNETNGDAKLLFDSPEGIRMMPIHLTMFGGDAPVLRSDATSPRTVFDGERFWISYLDARGDVVVGFLDEHNKPITMSLGAPQPERAGYELVMLDGAPTIFAVDEKGYTAYSMCVDAIGE